MTEAVRYPQEEENLDASPPKLIQSPPSVHAAAQVHRDRSEIAALDLQFQLATKRNDAETIDKILHRDFVLVLGNGDRVGRNELIQEAVDRTVEYEIQDEDPGTQKVVVFGDTGVVTARLRIKGVRAGKAFERLLWFSDTYVRTPGGWRYAFAQASLPLPAE